MLYRIGGEFLLAWILLWGFLDFLEAQVSPRLAPLPRELEFRRGERFQLVCSCRECGEPPLTFGWARDGASLLEGAGTTVRRFDEFSSSLTISALREDSAGNYTCVVSNRDGSDSSTVALKVLVPPTWLRQPYDMSVLSGARITLNCETSGVPKPTVTWRRSRGFDLQRTEVLPSSSGWRTNEDGSLSTSSARKEDEGFYSCEAHNGVGEGLRKTVRIEVQVPPTVTTPDSETVTVRRGQSAILRCDAWGDPPLSLSWSRANIPLVTQDSRIQIVEDSSPRGGTNSSSSVSIGNASAGDTGLYMCSARNTYGQDRATIRLAVVEHPSAPADFRASEVWCKSVRLSWRRPYDGNTPLRHYVVRYGRIADERERGVTETKVPAPQHSVVIRDLRPATAYHFRVAAVNAVGAGGESSDLRATTREEEPEAAPVNVHIKSIDASGFLLSWKPPPRDRWNGNLTAFWIGYKRVSHGGSAHSPPFTYKALPPTEGGGASEPRECRVRGLQESSSYTVVVRAATGAGLGPPSEPVVVKTSYGEIPGAPIVSLVSTEQTVVTLRVELKGKKKATPTQFNLYLREGSSHWVKLPLVPSPSPPPEGGEQHRVGGLQAGARYKLYVTARNEHGDGRPSEIIKFDTQPESTGGSVFSGYEEEDLALPFYARLSFIIPVAVSMTTVVVVPIAACCCLGKLDSLQRRRHTEGVESRGFTYTASSNHGGSNRPRSLPPLPSSSNNTGGVVGEESDGNNQYSTLQNYGSVIPVNDPRFPHFSKLLLARHSLVELPEKQAEC